jgi:acetyl esterase
MPLDPRVKRFLDVLAATNPPSTLSLSAEERRKGLAQLMRFSGPEERVAAVEERTVPGPWSALRVRVYTPLGATAATLPGLVYYHGGGFVAGTLETHDPVARALANAAGCRVVSVDYRLAPEHRFPAAIDDATAAAQFVRREAGAFGIDPTRLGIAGDSAGATLAAVVCHSLAASAGARPALQVLLCPILDYAAQTESRRTLASGYLLDEGTLAHDLAHYLPPGADPADPRVSPLRSRDLAGLPPTIIHSAEYDPLRDEAQAYAERLRLAGVPVSYTCHPGMVHLFYALGGVVPYARTAFGALGAEIRAALA